MLKKSSMRLALTLCLLLFSITSLLAQVDAPWIVDSTKNKPKIYLWLDASDLGNLTTGSKISQWENKKPGFTSLPVFQQNQADQQPTFVKNARGFYPAVRFSSGAHLSSSVSLPAFKKYVVFLVLGKLNPVEADLSLGIKPITDQVILSLSSNADGSLSRNLSFDTTGKAIRTGFEIGISNDGKNIVQFIEEAQSGSLSFLNPKKSYALHSQNFDLISNLEKTNDFFGINYFNITDTNNLHVAYGDGFSGFIDTGKNYDNLSTGLPSDHILSSPSAEIENQFNFRKITLGQSTDGLKGANTDIEILEIIILQGDDEFVEDYNRVASYLHNKYGWNSSAFHESDKVDNTQVVFPNGELFFSSGNTKTISNLIGQAKTYGILGKDEGSFQLNQKQQIIQADDIFQSTVQSGFKIPGRAGSPEYQISVGGIQDSNIQNIQAIANASFLFVGRVDGFNPGSDINQAEQKGSYLLDQSAVIDLIEDANPSSHSCYVNAGNVYSALKYVANTSGTTNKFSQGSPLVFYLNVKHLNERNLIPTGKTGNNFFLVLHSDPPTTNLNNGIFIDSQADKLKVIKASSIEGDYVLFPIEDFDADGNGIDWFTVFVAGESTFDEDFLDDLNYSILINDVVQMETENINFCNEDTLKIELGTGLFAMTQLFLVDESGAIVATSTQGSFEFKASQLSNSVQAGLLTLSLKASNHCLDNPIDLSGNFVLRFPPPIQLNPIQVFDSKNSLLLNKIQSSNNPSDDFDYFIDWCQNLSLTLVNGVVGDESEFDFSWNLRLGNQLIEVSNSKTLTVAPSLKEAIYVVQVTRKSDGCKIVETIKVNGGSINEKLNIYVDDFIVCSFGKGDAVNISPIFLPVSSNQAGFFQNTPENPALASRVSGKQQAFIQSNTLIGNSAFSTTLYELSTSSKPFVETPLVGPQEWGNTLVKKVPSPSQGIYLLEAVNRKNNCINRAYFKVLKADDININLVNANTLTYQNIPSRIAPYIDQYSNLNCIDLDVLSPLAQIQFSFPDLQNSTRSLTFDYASTSTIDDFDVSNVTNFSKEVKAENIDLSTLNRDALGNQIYKNDFITDTHLFTFRFSINTGTAGFCQITRTVDSQFNPVHVKRNVLIDDILNTASAFKDSSFDNGKQVHCNNNNILLSHSNTDTIKALEWVLFYAQTSAEILSSSSAVFDVALNNHLAFNGVDSNLYSLVLYYYDQDSGCIGSTNDLEVRVQNQLAKPIISHPESIFCGDSEGIFVDLNYSLLTRTKIDLLEQYNTITVIDAMDDSIVIDLTTQTINTATNISLIDSSQTAQMDINGLKSGFYKVRVENECGSVDSNNFEIISKQQQDEALIVFQQAGSTSVSIDRTTHFCYPENQGDNPDLQFVNILVRDYIPEQAYILKTRNQDGDLVTDTKFSFDANTGIFSIQTITRVGLANHYFVATIKTVFTSSGKLSQTCQTNGNNTLTAYFHQPSVLDVQLSDALINQDDLARVCQALPNQADEFHLRGKAVTSYFGINYSNVYTPVEYFTLILKKSDLDSSASSLSFTQEGKDEDTSTLTYTLATVTTFNPQAGDNQQSDLYRPVASLKIELEDAKQLECKTEFNELEVILLPRPIATSVTLQQYPLVNNLFTLCQDEMYHIVGSIQNPFNISEALAFQFFSLTGNNSLIDAQLLTISALSNLEYISETITVQRNKNTLTTDTVYFINAIYNFQDTLCTATSENIHVIHANDPLPPTVSSLVSSVICSNQTIVLAANAGMLTRSWNVLNNAGVKSEIQDVMINADNNFELNLQEGINNIVLELTNQFGCATDSRNVQLLLLSSGDSDGNVPLSTDGGVLGLCSGTVRETKLITVQSDDVSYSWFKDGVRIPRANQNIFTADSVGDYHVQLTYDGDMCVDDSPAISLAVIASPPKAIFKINLPNGDVLNSNDSIASTGIEVCIGSVFTLSLDNQNDLIDFIWIFNNTIEDQTIIQGNPQAVVSTNDYPSSGSYRLTVQGENRCTSDSDNVVLIVNPLPSPFSINAQKDFVCSLPIGNSIDIQGVSFILGNSYQWFKDNELIENTDPLNISIDQPGKYFVSITDQNNCIRNSNELNIVLNQSPNQPTLEVDNNQFCDEDFNLVRFDFFTENVVKYQFLQSDQDPDINSDITFANILTEILDPAGVYTMSIVKNNIIDQFKRVFKVIAINASNCTSVPSANLTFSVFDTPQTVTLNFLRDRSDKVIFCNDRENNFEVTSSIFSSAITEILLYKNSVLVATISQEDFNNIGTTNPELIAQLGFDEYMDFFSSTGIFYIDALNRHGCKVRSDNQTMVLIGQDINLSVVSDVGRFTSCFADSSLTLGFDDPDGNIPDLKSIASSQGLTWSWAIALLSRTSVADSTSLTVFKRLGDGFTQKVDKNDDPNKNLHLQRTILYRLEFILDSGLCTTTRDTTVNYFPEPEVYTFTATGNSVGILTPAHFLEGDAFQVQFIPDESQNTSGTNIFIKQFTIFKNGKLIETITQASPVSHLDSGFQGFYSFTQSGTYKVQYISEQGCNNQQAIMVNITTITLPQPVLGSLSTVCFNTNFTLQIENFDEFTALSTEIINRLRGPLTLGVFRVDSNGTSQPIRSDLPLSNTVIVDNLRTDLTAGGSDLLQISVIFPSITGINIEKKSTQKVLPVFAQIQDLEFTSDSNYLPDPDDDKHFIGDKGLPLTIFASPSDEGFTYNWQSPLIKDGFRTGNTFVLSHDEILTSTTIRVFGTDGNNCNFNDHALRITVFDSAKLPSVGPVDDLFKRTHIISPNGDGIFDKITFFNTDLYSENFVSIYDSTGRVVWSKDNFVGTVDQSNQITGDSWDGRDLSGKRLPTGVYYFVITFDNGTAPFKGTINILRKK